MVGLSKKNATWKLWQIKNESKSLLIEKYNYTFSVLQSKSSLINKFFQKKCTHPSINPVFREADKRHTFKAFFNQSENHNTLQESLVG